MKNKTYEKPIAFDVDQPVTGVRRYTVYARSETAATEKVKKDRINKNLNTALETLTNTFQSYGLSDIQNEIPQDSQGRYIIDTNSPEIIVILNRIKDEKGDGPFNNIKSIFVILESSKNDSAV